jgi:GT2 family glycosyltransferase
LITISIISHGHGAMMERLVTEVLCCPEVMQIILTLNIPESVMLPQDARLQVTHNIFPSGFASNHNAAFQLCTQPYFCPLNPDIQLQGNPFPALLAAMEETGAAIIAPLVTNPEGIVEDSVRHFPTITSLLLKMLGKYDGRYPVEQYRTNFYAEWIAGMFLLFHHVDFRRLQGFDTCFFLYYEDVDICLRAWKAGLKVVACPTVTVVHAAQRASRHNLRYLGWHLTSMARYFRKHWGRLPEVPAGG